MDLKPPFLLSSVVAKTITGAYDKAEQAGKKLSLPLIQTVQPWAQKIWAFEKTVYQQSKKMQNISLKKGVL